MLTQVRGGGGGGWGGGGVACRRVVWSWGGVVMGQHGCRGGWPGRPHHRCDTCDVSWPAPLGVTGAAVAAAAARRWRWHEEGGGRSVWVGST